MKDQRNYFYKNSVEQILFIRRILFAFIGILLLFSILVINLYRLQILHFEDYSIRSNQNHIKLIPIAPNRGIIYDRNGIALAVNRTIYQLEVIPKKIVNLKKMFQDLRPIINLTDNDVENFEKERIRSRCFTPVTIKTSLNDIQIARFAVNKYRFPGVEIRSYQQRYYPFGKTLTHVIGYVSKVNNYDIARLDKENKWINYTATRDIGRLGIESYYEDVLHGTSGHETIEVDSHGCIVRRLRKQLPQSGKDIWLTIDVKLQQYIEHLLTGIRAAVVVIDPRTGEILAMVSSPSYDPNLFVEGISNKDYKILLQDKNQPLYNRVIQAAYPPASTVKPYIAVSALHDGVINRNTILFDPGWWKLPGSEKRYRDWKKFGHGRLNVTKSLEESADTFFYQIAYDMGIDRLSEWMNKFGYGKYTGIDLPQENPGNMPTRDWKIRRFKKPWYQGDTISVGIGQGYWTATPLQMNNALMILINNGNVKIPHLLLATCENNLLVPHQKHLSISIGDTHPEYWNIAKDGMYGVANRPNGTAYKSFSDAPYKIAAKSGTAQIFSLKDKETYNFHKITERLRDHKLMTAFAPYDKPRVSVTMILENGGSRITIGTLMRQILDYIISEEDKIFSNISPISINCKNE